MHHGLCVRPARESLTFSEGGDIEPVTFALWWNLCQHDRSCRMTIRSKIPEVPRFKLQSCRILQSRKLRRKFKSTAIRAYLTRGVVFAETVCAFMLGRQSSTITAAGRVARYFATPKSSWPFPVSGGSKRLQRFCVISAVKNEQTRWRQPRRTCKTEVQHLA